MALVSTANSIIDVSKLHGVLEKHYNTSKKQLAKKHPHAVSFFEKTGFYPGKIRDNATKLLASGVVASTLMLSAPAVAQLVTQPVVYRSELTGQAREQLLSQQVKSIVPPSISKLTFLQEQQISKLVSDFWGIQASASLDNKRLNHVYGFMGLEQHLPRFPGDTVSKHSKDEQKAGITPAKGAWGFFVNSEKEMTEDIVNKEKYYVAVQTLYLPDWNTNWQELKEWYKYRKVLVINIENGKTIVADIADAGPANWTGKQFGGSPELMTYLQLRTGKQKGKVIMLFLSDPENSVPLGPVVYTGNKIK